MLNYQFLTFTLQDNPYYLLSRYFLTTKLFWHNQTKPICISIGFHFIKAAQYRALQSVNQQQTALYWSIGQLIVERQQAHGWGKSVVERLAEELQQAFPNTLGYSARNLWRMRSLYEEYSRSDLILPPVVAEIAWSHNIIILEKCKDEHQRFFYIKMTAQHRWSKTALSNAIAGRLWENTLIHQHNFEETLQKQKPKIASNSERLTSHPKHRRQLPRRFPLIFDSQPLRSLSPYSTGAFAGCPPGSQSCRTHRLGELFPCSIRQ